MKKRGTKWGVMILTLAVLATGSACEEDKLDDSINPWARFLGVMLSPGDVVNVFAKLSYYVGRGLDPKSLDNSTVMVRREDGTYIPGTVDGFDYTDCGELRYILLVRIYVLSDFDLAGTSGWFNLRLYGEDHRILLPTGPEGQIEAFQALVLYIARDGSTYYAFNDTLLPDSNPRTHDVGAGFCDAPGGGGCPSLTPDVAYTEANLAAPATAMPSTEPLTLRGNTIDQTAGLNAGLIDEISTNDVMVAVMAIEAAPPYFGWDQLNNINDFMVGGFWLVMGGYYPYEAAYLEDAPPCYPRGIVFSPFNGTPCDLNELTNYTFLLQGIRLRDGSPVPDTEIPFSTRSLPSGYTPNYCVP